MSDFLEVKCPDCGIVLVVNRRTGKTVEVKRSIIEDTTGDRFKDAEIKIKTSASALEKKVAEAKAREAGKMDRLNAMFAEGLEKAKSEGEVERPVNPMDLD